MEATRSPSVMFRVTVCPVALIEATSTNATECGYDDSGTGATENDIEHPRDAVVDNEVIVTEAIGTLS